MPNAVQLANYNNRSNKDTEALNKLTLDEFLCKFPGNYTAGITIGMLEKKKNPGRFVFEVSPLGECSTDSLFDNSQFFL